MIDLLVAAVLLVIAALHVYWGVGGHWPGRDAASLARTVAGFKNIAAMPPPAACFVVAGALVAAAVWPLMMSGRIAMGLPNALLVVGSLVLTMVFLARGVAAYLPAWRQLTPEQPFARLDRQLYGPLCLILGCLIAIVTAKGWLT
jgi:Protein of unknown function (DUF3995)